MIWLQVGNFENISRSRLNYLKISGKSNPTGSENAAVKTLIIFKFSREWLASADLKGRGGGRAHPGSKFFQFHAVFGRNWQGFS